MIAYIIGTCAKGIVYYRTYTAVKSCWSCCPLACLLEQDSRAPNLLAAERAQEIGHQAVHQLEIGRQRRRILLRVVEDLLAIAFGVHRRAGAAVDEHELRPQDESLAFHVLPNGADDPASEAVVRLLIALHEARGRAARE